MNDFLIKFKFHKFQIFREIDNLIPNIKILFNKSL